MAFVLTFSPHPYSFVEPIILDSILNHPEDWDIDDHHCNNARLRIEIWIANGRGFLEVKLDRDRIIGGMVLIPIAPWRWRLWRVIQKQRSYQALERLHKWIEDAT